MVFFLQLLLIIIIALMLIFKVSYFYYCYFKNNQKTKTNTTKNSISFLNNKINQLETDIDNEIDYYKKSEMKYEKQLAEIKRNKLIIDNSKFEK